MKVLFISRATLYDSPGGDTIQIEKTAKYLRKLGLSVDIGLTNESFDYGQYDLVHFFNIIRPADILFHAKKSKKYVISTIFVDYEEFEINAGKPFRKFLTKILGGDFIEYLKAITKHLLGKEKIISKEYLYWGHKKSVKYLMDNAKALLPNSWSEGKRLIKKYGQTATPIYKIINGVDIQDNNNKIPFNEKYKDSIVCVGRIERLKNQLNLIKAVNNSGINCYIIGKPSINDSHYYNECKKIASNNIKFINYLNQEKLFSILKSAKVHVLPSWFETTGLVSLEAAYLDCSIVISVKGDQKEYFKEYAHYCNPNDVLSIKEAIINAYNSNPSIDLKELIEKNYTWKNTAKETLEVYKSIL